MLAATIAAIRAPDREIARAAARRQATLTKPPGSLGRLETYAEQICGVQRTLAPSVARRAIAVFAADHGVADEGVSAYPQAVTAQMVANFRAGGAAICALARAARAELLVVDVGVGAGTANFAREPAMSQDATIAVVERGIAIVRDLEVEAIGVGEMGIANTTSAAALAAVLCAVPPAIVTGRGTGIDAAQHARKVEVIERALALHAPRVDDPLGLLAAVGGLEIAAIAGACIGGASSGKVVVIDGFISTAGAAIAAVLAPEVKPYLIAAHRSVEPGHALLLAQLGLHPILDLGLRLGEGTGAALALPILDGALAAFREMATFAEAGVENRT